VEHEKEERLIKFINLGKGEFEDLLISEEEEAKGDHGNFKRLDEGNSWLIIYLKDILLSRKPTKKDYEIAKQREVEHEI